MTSYLFALILFPVLAGAWYEDRDHTCYDLSMQSLTGTKVSKMLSLASKVSSFQVKPGGMYAHSNPCIKDETYGIDGLYIWVDRGCNAVFRVCYKLGDNILVLCSGVGYGYHECHLHDKHKIHGIEKINQLPFSKTCTRDRTYGYKDNMVWVRSGCKVALRVTVNYLRGDDIHQGVVIQG